MQTDVRGGGLLSFTTPAGTNPRGVPALGGRRVAVVGAGASGLACANELLSSGVAVTVFETERLPGGIAMLNGEGSGARSMVSAEVTRLRAQGGELRCGIQVGPGGQLAFSALEREHAAIFVSVGLGGVRDLDIPGELLPGVYDAITFMRRIKTAGAMPVRAGERAVVIGGGTLALDAALLARQVTGVDVSVVFRHGPAELAAQVLAVGQARAAGVRFIFHAQPMRVVGRDRAQALECLRVTATSPRRYAAVPGSELTLPADAIIKATGQQPRIDVCRGIPGLPLDAGRPHHDAETYQTPNPRYFVGGSFRTGLKDFGLALLEGRRAAHAIRRYLETGSAR